MLPQLVEHHIFSGPYIGIDKTINTVSRMQKSMIPTKPKSTCSNSNEAIVITNNNIQAANPIPIIGLQSAS